VHPPRPPFFVFGCGRSGTSLLTRMLDAHAGIAVPYESHLYNRIYPLLRPGLDLGRESTRRRLVAEILRTAPFRKWSPRPSLEGTLAAIRRPGFHGIVQALFEGWTAARGKSRWGEKTPQHTLHWREILDGFPDLKVLHLVRDGRDVALSFYEAPFGPKHIFQAASRWTRALAAAEAAREALPADAFLVIRYEDLVERTEEELRRICAFLGEPFDEEMLAFHRKAVSYPTDKRNSTWLQRPVRIDEREKWRTRLTAREQRIFEALAGDELERYGYPRVMHGPRIGRLEALCCRYVEHPPRRLWAMATNLGGYAYALETVRLRMTLPRIA
jgi:hypothetical protein